MKQCKTDKKRFVRYKEGAELYSMSQPKFEQLAKDNSQDTASAANCSKSAP